MFRGNLVWRYVGMTDGLVENTGKEELAGCAGATCGGRLVSIRFICQTILLLRCPKPDSRELRLTTQCRHCDFPKADTC